MPKIWEAYTQEVGHTRPHYFCSESCADEYLSGLDKEVVSEPEETSFAFAPASGCEQCDESLED